MHFKYLLHILYSYSGETPAESDFKVLEIARKLEMYGVRFHPAADREGTKINLSVAHMGLQVFQVQERYGRLYVIVTLVIVVDLNVK